MAVAAGIGATSLALLDPPKAGAASPCGPLSISGDYVNRVNGALRSQRDIWGDQVLARPGGPTYDSLKDYLKPLVLGGLTDSGTHYLPFGQPDGSSSTENALHEMDGSKFYSNRPRDDDPNLAPNSVTVKVGSGGERYGSCASRLKEPVLPGGYPILQTDYTDTDGVHYSQESFAARAPQVSQASGYGNLVSWIRLTVDRGTSSATRAVLDFEAGTPGLFRSGSELVGATPHGLRTYLVFSPGAEYDPGSGRLRYSIPLADSAPVTVYLVRLNQPNTLTAPIAPSAVGYEAARAGIEAYWNQRLAQGATVTVPEARVSQAQRNLLIQNINMGKYYSIGNSYQWTFTEQYDAINTLGEYGFSQQERALLEELMDWTQNGRQGFDGLFKGYKLLSAARYYKRTLDGGFIDRYTREFTKWAEDFKAEIAADPNGLLKQERWTGDFGGSCYALSYNQSFGLAGLRDMVDVWSTSGHAELAQRYGPTVASLRRNLRAAIDRSKVTLRDGTVFVPGCLLQGVQPYDRITATEVGSYWNLVMPAPFSLGLFEPKSAETRAILNYLSNHGSRLLGMVRFNMGGRPVGGADPNALSGYRSPGTNPVYNYAVADLLAQNDQADQLVLSLYGLLAHGVSRGTYVGGEGETVGVVPGEYYRSMFNPPNSVTNAAILHTLRQMMVHETRAVSGRADGLRLAYSTPRGWLEPGKQIAVSNAPTEFGPVGYTLERPTGDPLAVQARIEVPPRLGGNHLSVRLRVPAGLRMSSVALNGESYSRFDPQAETVELTGRPGPLTLEIRYREVPIAASPGTNGSSPGTAGQPTAAPRRDGATRRRSRCFPRRVRVGRRSLGRTTVGERSKTVLRRLGPPRTKRARAWGYCVRGGGRVLIGFSRGKRVVFIASTARGHTRRGIGAGQSVRRLLRVFRATGLRAPTGGALRMGRGSSRQVLFGTRNARIRYVGVVDRGILGGRARLLRTDATIVEQLR